MKRPRCFGFRDLEATLRTHVEISRIDSATSEGRKFGRLKPEANSRLRFATRVIFRGKSGNSGIVYLE